MLTLALACEENAGGGEPSSETSPSSSGSGNSGNSGETGGSDTGGEAPPSGAIEDCRKACDDLLFYDCVGADEHEECWNACPIRTEAEIELFVACERNANFCDLDCLQNFLDADPVDPTGPQETTAGGGPDTAGGPSCTVACLDWVAMGCTVEVEGFTSCPGFCNAIGAALEEVVVMCIEQADGCDLPAECSFPDGE